jgi:hypothetical protein
MNETAILSYMSNLSDEEFRGLEDKIGLERWTKTYNLPSEMYEWFRGGISKHRGDLWENKFVAACNSLGPKTNGDHDATLNDTIVEKQKLRGATVEIKFFTCMTKDSAKDIEKRGYALLWGQRARTIKRSAINPTGWAVPTKGTWQQVKPTCASYGLFSALHGNGAIHYWVPYHLIQSTPGKKNLQEGKIPMGIQHRNHATEGQVDLNDRIHELFFLDVTENTPFLKDLSSYDLNRYESIKY